MPRLYRIAINHSALDAFHLLLIPGAILHHVLHDLLGDSLLVVIAQESVPEPKRLHCRRDIRKRAALAVGPKGVCKHYGSSCGRRGRGSCKRPRRRNRQRSSRSLGSRSHRGSQRSSNRQSFRQGLSLQSFPLLPFHHLATYVQRSTNLQSTEHGWKTTREPKKFKSMLNLMQSCSDHSAKQLIDLQMRNNVNQNSQRPD